MYGIILVLIIATLGGFIALLGDRVGMRVGKKRLSIFGLRPKYSSMIITVVTGIFISGTTLLLLAFVSNDVRTALFRMKSIQKELLVKAEKERILTLEVLKIETELVKVNNQKEQTEKLLNQMEEELQKVNQEKAETELLMEKIGDQYHSKLVELKKAKEELAFEQQKLVDLAQVTKSLKENTIALEVERERLLKEIQALSSEAARLKK
jgi:uncharacterized protein (DUF3084 family)